jgi:hypothetical protein
MNSFGSDTYAVKVFNYFICTMFGAGKYQCRFDFLVFQDMDQ